MNSTESESDDIINDTEKKSINVECKDTGIGNVDSSYYTYHLIDPRTDIPFYVGKGKGYRYKRHVGLVRKNKVPNNNPFLFRTILQILNAGCEVKYAFVGQNLTESSAFSLETSEIKRLRSDGIQLCNLTDGGDGVTMTSDVRQKIGNKMRGRSFSVETRTKMRLSKLGKRDSPEMSKKRRLWLSGHVVHDSTRRKLHEIRIGRYKKDANGKYQKISTEIIDKMIALYTQYNDVRRVQNQLKLSGHQISWNVIKKRLVDSGVYLGNTRYFV